MKDRSYLPASVTILVVTLLLALLYEAHYQSVRVGTMGFPLDDSWIFWVFARNLATGHGFSFNPGQPVLGTTSILWVLVLAGSYLVTHGVVFISKFWGVVFFLSAVLLTYRICLFHTRSKKVACLAVLTFALAPSLIFGALSGMETSLATFLVCLTLFFHLKERGKSRKIFFAPLFGALCFAARPELISLYPLLLLHGSLFPSEGEGGRSVPVIIRKLIIFALFLCPVFVLSFSVSGHALPNTLAAKALDSGLLWAIGNFNLEEILVSLSLNPFVWGGTMLVGLVGLNVFWAFFWANGLVLSFLRKDTLIYPLLFFLIPILRGVIAPVGTSFSGEHRYVSFLFPLLAVFFVIGWERLEVLGSVRVSVKTLRKWLLSAAGVFAILALFFYVNPLVRKDLFLGFFSRYYFPAIQAKSTLLNFCDLRFVFCFAAAFIALAASLGTTGLSAKLRVGRNVLWALLVAGVVLQVGFLINRAQRYALSVKNINQMQVHLGRWISENLPEGSLVAINDVGAIKFFGNRECLDLEGLVSPSIVPYKVMGKDSYPVYLNKHRPDYFVIFPIWYPSTSAVLGLWERVLYDVGLYDNIACGGGGYMLAAKPDWQLFDSTFAGSGILDIEPYVPRKSLKRRWHDAQQRQELASDWKLYEEKGIEAESGRSFNKAGEFFLRAESYHPESDEFYTHLAAFYENTGDSVRSLAAGQKATWYRLFPPPGFQFPGVR